MSNGKIDFAGINAGLLNRAESFLRDLFPAGKLKGREFCVGDIHGAEGESLKINITNGRGADFASGETYSDLIAVYAAHHGIGMGEAAKQLSPNEYRPTPNEYRAPVSAGPTPKSEPTITRPPTDAPAHDCHHYKHGAPSAVYEYRAATGLIHYVARYDLPNGKEIVPWSWDGSRWVAKGYPKPRPLYGLAELQTSNAPVIIIEGEKCVDHMRTRGIARIPITWSGGANAWKHTDWSPLTGRDVLLFPDHDEPGRKAMLELASVLVRTAASLKIIDHAALDLPDGWDIADTQWSAAELNEWARPLIKPITPPPEWVGYDPGEPGGDYTPNIPDNVTPIKRGKPRTKRDGSPPNGKLIENGKSVFLSWEQLGLDTNSKGIPHENVANFLKVFNSHPDISGRIWLDEFHGCIYSTLFSDKPKEWSDTDDTRLLSWLQSVMRMPKANVLNTRRALDQYAEQNTRNEVIEWLRAIEWDKTPRLADMMSDIYGTPRDRYHSAVGRCWLVGMVARAIDPGCKVDTVVVFEGGQGLRKTTSLEILGGKWYVSIADKFGQRDFLQSMDGAWLIELPDMSNFRGSDIDHVKAIVTTKSDRYCRRYSRRAGTYPRRSVFTATANGSQWNSDATGARRFHPVRCFEVNLAYLRENREQLFAEAMHLYSLVSQNATDEERLSAGADWWSVPSGDALFAQEERYIVDPWEDAVRDYCATRDQVQIMTVLTVTLNVPIERTGRAEANRVSAILRRLGFDSRVHRDGAKVSRSWIRQKNSVTEQQKIPL